MGTWLNATWQSNAQSGKFTTGVPSQGDDLHLPQQEQGRLLSFSASRGVGGICGCTHPSTGVVCAQGTVSIPLPHGSSFPSWLTVE